MSAIILVQYPRVPDGKLDVDYYVNTHVPLCARLWSSIGLRSMVVTQPTQESDFVLQVLVTWDSMEAWNTAKKLDLSKEIFDDVEKFTNITPKFTSGTVVSSWGA